MHAEIPSEYDLIAPFLAANCRSRWQTLLATAKGRKKLRGRLSSLRDLDQRLIRPVPADRQNVDAIEGVMRSAGAPADCECHVLSENPAIDGKRMSLHEALSETVGFGFGTIVLCLGRPVGYYEAEGPGQRFILARRERS